MSEKMRDTKFQEPDEGARSFTHFAGMVCDGELNAHASRELHALGQTLQKEAAAREAKVGGSLTIVVNFKADHRGVVATTYEVKAKMPKPRTLEGTMFLTPGGNFSPESHRQPNLPGVRAVKTLEDAPRAVREVG